MKKIAVILVALVAVFAVSCKKSPVQEIIDYYTELLPKIENADSQEALESINKEAEAFMTAHVEALQADVTADEQKKLEDVLTKASEATKAAYERLGIALPGSEGEEVASEEGDETAAEDEAAPAEEEAAPSESE